MAKSFGLENWNHAASPCLRSRLAFGVEATQEHLARVEKSELLVREAIQLAVWDNMRVRVLAKGVAAIEVDQCQLELVQQLQPEIKPKLQALGFADVIVRAFKSGNVSRSS